MGWKNIPTLLRIALLPVVLLFIGEARAGASLIAITLILIALGTDILDSMFSRWYAQRVSSSHLPLPTGSFLEPVADKLLIWGVLLSFAFRSWIWLIPLTTFIIRDLAVNILLLYASRDNISIREEPYRQAMKYIQYTLVLALTGKDYFFYRGHFASGILLLAALLLALAAIGLAVAAVAHHLISYRQKVSLRAAQEDELRKKAKKGSMIILANRKSGSYRDHYRRHLLRIFTRRRNAPLYLLSRGKNLFAPLSRRIKNAQQVILAGGDGTFERALNDPLFRGKSLGFFPLGSGNALYAYFYRGKRFEYLRSRFAFRETPLDIVRLQWDSKTRDTTFLALGIDAEVIRLRRRRDAGFGGYVAASLRAAFPRKTRWPAEVFVDGKKYFFPGCTAITIGKVPYYGFGLRSLLGDVLPDDGRLYGVAVVNTHARVWDKAARLAGLLLSSMNLLRPPLVPFQGKEIIIRSRIPVPLQAGGDFVDYVKEVRCSVGRKQKVLVV